MSGLDAPGRQVRARASGGFAPGWKMLGGELRTVRGPLLRVIAWSMVQGLPALASGRVIALALDRGFLAHRPVTGLLYLLVLGGCLLISAVATRAMFPCLADTVEPLRDLLVTRLIQATIREAAAAVDAPDTVAIARLTSQVETVRGLVGAILRSARPSVVSLVAALAGLLTLAPAAALFVLVPLATSAVVFAVSLRSLAHRRHTVVVLDEAIAAVSAPVIGGARDIAACAAQDRAAAPVDELIRAQSTAMIRLARSGALRTITISLGGELPLVGLLIAGSWLVGSGKLNAGQLIGAISYVATGMLPALRSLVAITTTWGIQLGTVLARIQQSVASAGEPGHTGRTGIGGGPCGAREPSGYAISIRGLEFRYGTGAEPVINNLCLDIGEGDHLAIVGPSGVGKSTLTQLMVGGLVPDRGEIRLGGGPAASLTKRQLCQMEALIPQEAYIFAGTLRENLTYLCPGAGDRTLAEAAAATGLTALAERLGGFDVRIGAGGALLSSGEAQLVAATRVYLCDARVVILDEATCHLDPSAEAVVEQAFAARPGTLIVVAHRISSARRAKRILLLDGAGAVLGTPGDLPSRSPLYAELLGYWQPEPGSAARRTLEPSASA